MAAGIVRSFDVFDTVLTRVHAAADDVHWQVAEVAVARGHCAAPEPFVRARREAETRAWRVDGPVAGKAARAIRIDTVYRILGELLGWTPAKARQLMRVEIEVERAAVRPVPGMAEALRRHRRQGDRVCFVSDMHLAEAHVRSMLAQWQLVAAGEPVIVSSDHGVTKRGGGRLFAVAARELGVPTWQVRHCGDDWRADVGMAWRRGVPAVHRPAARLNRFERLALDHLPAEDWRARSAVSASRLARLATTLPEAGSARRALLCSTVAPFVTGYALWLIEQAMQRGMRALFFMARDMQIVCEVATLLCRAKGLPLECVYIHASRAAWQPAAYGGDAAFDLFWLSDQPESADPRDALGRLIDAPAIDALQAAGALRREAREALRDTLARWLAEPRVAAAVADAVAQRRELLLGYLAQRGYAADGSCALVDAGWRGTLQACLARAHGAAGVRPVVPAYYIGLRHRVAAPAGCTMEGFVPDAEVGRLGYSLVAVVEGFLTARHGTTLGYRRTPSGAIEAVLAGDPPRAILEQWSEVRASCLAHAEALATLPAFDAATGALGRALAQPLLVLCAAPLPRDAAALRHWRFDAGRATPLLKPLVKPLSIIDLARLVRAAARRTPEADVYLAGPWLRGSLAATNRVLRRGAGWLLAAGKPT